MGNYGSGWECVTVEDSREDARCMLKDYRDNDKQHPYKITYRRVRHEKVAAFLESI
jgi:hypothetical protein